MSFGLVVNAPESSIENELEKFILWCSSSGDSESTQTLVVGTPAVTDSEVVSSDSEPYVQTVFFYF